MAPTSGSASESAASRWLIALLSFVVCLAVAWILYAFPWRPVGRGGPSVLPAVDAVLNGAAAVFAALGFYFIRHRQVAAHRACMLGAVGLSTGFLITYLIHHAEVGSVPFRGQGWARLVYFALLIPHVALAVAMVPMVLLTFLRALRGRIEAHRAIARWTLPLWIFVSVSGVLVYWMLYHG